MSNQHHQGQDFNVVVAVPSMGEWKAAFGISLIGLFAHAAGTAPANAKNWQVSLESVYGSILSKSRQTAVRAAIKRKASHLLFIDSDMTFPPDTLMRLLKRDKQIVAANCPTKTIPPGWTARKKDVSNPLGGKMVSSTNKSGLERVWKIGFGVCLIDMKVFNLVSEPWFDIGLVAGTNEYMGEDWFFFQRCEQYGIEPYIDHELSQEIGHVGNFEYDMQYGELPEETEAMEKVA